MVFRSRDYGSGNNFGKIVAGYFEPVTSHIDVQFLSGLMACRKVMNSSTSGAFSEPHYEFLIPFY